MDATFSSSHKELWEQAVASGTALTIAEDDAVLNRRFSEKAAKVLAALPSDWDLIFWGWNFDSILHCDIIPGLKDCVMQFDPSPLRETRDRFQDIDVDPIATRLFGAFGIFCYTVSPKWYRLLRQHCFPLRNEYVPIPGLPAG